MGSVSIKSVLSLAVAFGLATFALTASALPDDFELPEGYTKLDYVESDGRQWVDTGYKVLVTTKIEATFAVTEYNETDTYKGAYVFSRIGKYSSGTEKSRCQFRYGSPALFASSEQTDTSTSFELDFLKHTVVKDKGDFYVDGVKCASLTASSSNDMTLPLFAHLNQKSAVSGMSSLKLYSVTISEGDTIKRQLVPAMNAEGVAGLYDLAHEDGATEFYVSKTTTPLIAGVDAGAPELFGATLTGTIADGITASVDVVGGEKSGTTIECYIGTDTESWQPVESWSHTTEAATYSTTQTAVTFGSYFSAFRATYTSGGKTEEVWSVTNRITFVDVKDHWLYDPLTETVTDGMWKFAAEVDGENMSVGKWTDDGYPLDPSPLDFSKPVCDTDQNVYVITNLNTQFGTNAGNWYDINPSEAGGRVAMLVLPESGLVSIRAGAFAGCSSITNIVNFLPDSVQTLGAAAFFGINNTKCVCDLVCNTKNVGDSVFKSSTAIKSVTFGPRTKNVGSGSHKSSTFSGCVGITNIVFDAACENVKLTFAFDACRIVELTLNGVTNVATRAFDSCQFRSIIFDKTLQFVSSTAFNDSKGGTTRSTLREVRFLGPPPQSFNPEFYGTVAHSPADDNLVTTYVPHKYAAAWQEYATNGEINKKDSTFALEKLTITDDPTKRLLLWGDSAQGLLLLVK